MRLFLILLILPIVEIVLFIEVGSLIGTWPTIALVVLTGLLGAFLLRRQGLSALHLARARLAAGENPGWLLADSAMTLLAGLLLVLPGFFTDTLGLALLVPPVRRLIWKGLAPRLTVVHVATQGRRPAGHPPRGGQTIDGEYEEVEVPSGPGFKPGRLGGDGTTG